MRKSKKTIIYMLVALFAAVSTVLVDFNISYAQTSYSDVPDADWKLMQGGNVKDPGCNVGISDNYSTDFPVLQQSLDKAKYTESCAYLNCDLKSGTSYVLESDTEIVLVCQNSSDGTPTMYGKEGSMYFCALSQSRIYSMLVGYKYDTSVSGELQSTSFVETSDSNNYKVGFTDGKISGTDLILKTLFNTRTDGENKQLEYAVYTGKMKVFSSVSDAEQYFKTGDTSNMAWQGGTPKQEFDSGLLLNDFDVQFHDSNKFEECYLDVKYTIPEELKSVSSFQIDMEEQYDWCGHFSGSVSDWEESHTGTNYIDVLNHADGFRIYLKDIKAIDNFIDQYDGFFNATHKRQVLGSFTGLNIPFGDYLLGNVKVSCLDVKFHLVANKKYGHYVDYNLNLLTGIGVKNSYVPDTDGNYTSNNDSKVNGHYYTDVGTDAAGNTTYNYYYYYPDGGKEKVSSEDAANNTITNTVQEGAIKIDNSPTFNNNITVEGDTISNSANSYADSKSDATTNKSFIDKFLGFFDIIENNSFLGVFAKVFGWLPPGVSTLITTALGIIVGIRVFKFFK
jgi:hypothetical protein